MQTGQGVSEIFQSFTKGMHGGLHPSILGDQLFAKGLNLQQTKGLLRTRNPFTEVTDLPEGKFQGAFIYRLKSSDRLVFGVSGTVYSLNLSTLILTSFTRTLSAVADHFHFCQADRYCIVQDGVAGDSWDEANWPVILHEEVEIDQHTEGSSYYIANPGNRLPKGGPMAYGHGRLFVAVSHIPTIDGDTATWSENLAQTAFMAGDVIKSDSISDVIRFTETQYLNEGGAFSLPQELGPIQAMAMQRNISSTGAGYGPLLVFGIHGVSAFNINVPRSAWKSTDLSQMLFSTGGTQSDWSLAPVNNDLYYRGSDGIRTLRYTASSSSGNSGLLSNDPISREVEDWLARDSQSEQQNVSVASSNNRMLATAVGALNEFDEMEYQGLISLDTSPLAGLGQPGTPAYDGLWTGFGFLQVLSGSPVGRGPMYAVARVSGTLTLLTLASTSGLEYGNGVGSRVELPARAFQSFPAEIALEYVDVWLSDIIGPVSFRVYVRGDDYPYWLRVGEELNFRATGDPGRLNRIRFTPSIKGCSAESGKNLLGGNTLQICLDWTGHLCVSKCMVRASIRNADGNTPACKVESQVDWSPGASDVELEDFSYQVVI